MSRNIREELRLIVAGHLEWPVEKVTDDADLVEDLGIDSLDKIEIVIGVEQAFKIEITEDEDFAIVLFGDLVTLVESKVKAVAA